MLLSFFPNNWVLSNDHREQFSPGSFVFRLKMTLTLLLLTSIDLLQSTVRFSFSSMNWSVHRIEYAGLYPTSIWRAQPEYRNFSNSCIEIHRWSISIIIIIHCSWWLTNIENIVWLSKCVIRMNSCWKRFPVDRNDIMFNVVRNSNWLCIGNTDVRYGKVFDILIDELRKWNMHEILEVDELLMIY